MHFFYHCQKCKLPYPEHGLPYSCPNCGNYFTASIDSSSTNFSLRKEPGLWKFKNTFSQGDGLPVIYLGEGGTPLVKRNYYQKNIFYKLEYLNPTGSYKDRGTAVLVSELIKRGITEVVEDSSGNAGASLAAYTAANNIKANIYVPEDTSGPKLRQIEKYHAKIKSVPGSRKNCSLEVQTDSQKHNIPYASHALQPFGLSGISTISFEVFEQLEEIPGSIIAPVGHGNLIYGIMLGFKLLKTAGIIEKLPVFVGTQPKAYSPFVSSFNKTNKTITEEFTIAEGTRISEPSRLDDVLSSLSASDHFVTANDQQILNAMDKLSSFGFFVEPTSALSQVAFEKLRNILPQPIVIILTGFGLKSEI